MLLTIGHKLYKRGHPVASLAIDALVRVIFGADVPSRIDLPSSVTFMHNGLGTVVDEHVTFLGAALVFQGVTIGNLIGRPSGTPTIGHHVVIGAGATVVGGISLGDGCYVGAGALVTRDVPANKMVRAARVEVVDLLGDNVSRFWSDD